MNKTYLIAIVAALVAAPLALAHEPKGTPKNYCEEQASGEWLLHEYGPAASGNVIQGYEDGNVGGDCEPGFGAGHTCIPEVPDCLPAPRANCPVDLTQDPPVCIPPCWHVHLYAIHDHCLFVNPPLADYDGHAEYTRGGAWLLVNSGTGAPSADANVGAGTLFCFGDAGHHANFATVTVDDLVLGGGAEVAIAADTFDFAGTGQGCGDFESDEVSEGIGTVTATFPAGLDGTYQVYVRGSQGHILTN